MQQYTNIQLTLGNLSFGTQDIQYLELTSSVFVLGEQGKISVVLQKYNDIYKLPLEGTLNLSDPQNPHKFWKTPLQFYVINEYVLTQVNYGWVVTFEFINKHALELMTKVDNMVFKNKSNEQIIRTIVSLTSDNITINTNNTITNKYKDKPLVWYPSISAFQMLQYLLPRSNPVNDDLLLMFLVRNTLNIKTPNRKSVSGTIDTAMGSQFGNLSVTNYTYKLKPNLPVLRKIYSNLEVLQYDNTQIDNDKYLQGRKQLYNEVSKQFSKVAVPQNLYSTTATSSLMYTGENDNLFINSIISYMINEMLFDYQTFEFTTTSDNTKFFLDTGLQVNFYNNIDSPKIDSVLSDIFYIMATHRVIKPANNPGIPPNQVNMIDTTRITAVQYPKIKGE